MSVSISTTSTVTEADGAADSSGRLARDSISRPMPHGVPPFRFPRDELCSWNKGMEDESAEIAMVKQNNH